MSEHDPYDLLVVGGGINGAGIARDASGRGLRVLLAEQDDLASHTSSASTKLVHGGLRYLEYYEFSLVRKALKEREVLLGIAPHIIWPLRFVMPHVRELRPAWMIRMGLFLYDHLGGRKRLPPSEGVRLRQHVAGEPLDPALTRGFIYSDCWVQDARLVVLNALDAAERGARVLPRTRCVGARRVDGLWHVTLESTLDGAREEVTARALVNAGGPWVARFLDDSGIRSERSVHLVKGSHIVVPQLFDHEYAYIFQHTDGRIVFAIPYERDFTLIGTTDVVYDGDPASASASREEIEYLCTAVNRYFRREVTPDEVVWTYSGVRALYDEDDTGSASAVSRDYLLDLNTDGGAPLLSVFGGKITTYRTLAREAMDRLADTLGAPRHDWTGTEALPGGDLPGGDPGNFVARLRERRPWLPAALAERLVRDYGSRVERLLGDAASLDDLGECFGADLYAAEVDYLTRYEWAYTADDVLWRRSKLGLRLGADQAARVAAYLAARLEERKEGDIA
ncbi:glycerol-3-phosphate dehydrogenase [Arhodomonas sp. AD133]|uniref:glycerol-3-phosphate dehydrogenase n=1 Tax=Arhodomonas sp. AD133 TaxID=3415009 RepID=UPI003EC1512B